MRDTIPTYGMHRARPRRAYERRTLGRRTLRRAALLRDSLRSRYSARVPTSEMPSAPEAPPGWSIDSWRARPIAQEVIYADAAEVDRCVAQLRRLPPLVTSWEIERLKSLLSDAQRGRRFILQGGDCAESLDDTRPSVIVNKLKILLQMSLVLIHGGATPAAPH